MKLTAALICLVFSAHLIAQNHPPSTQHSSPTSKTIKVVAGVVGDDGSVKYLPHVNIRLMPKSYYDAEQAVTQSYSQRIEVLSTQRDSEVKDLVGKRVNELEQARSAYDTSLIQSLSQVQLAPLDAVPECVEHWKYIQEDKVCSTYTPASSKLHLSPQFRSLIASIQIAGQYDPKTYRANLAPFNVNMNSALSSVKLSTYMSVPEFKNMFSLIFKKDSKQIKNALGKSTVSPGDNLPPDLESLLLQTIVSSWYMDSVNAKNHKSYDSADIVENYFSGVSTDMVAMLLSQMEKSGKDAVQTIRDSAMRQFIANKDAINARYDELQSNVDASMREKSKEAEDERKQSIVKAENSHPAIQQVITSLQGETEISISSPGGVIYAEDVTTDRHMRWTIPVSFKTVPKVLELTNSNSIPSAPNSFASASDKKDFPKASTLAETELDEYNIRYGSRILKTWGLVSIAHEAHPESPRLGIIDSQLGFAFAVKATSENVFNTLRVSDNDIAVRFFKEIVVNYLQLLPADLSSTGGGRAFQAVSLEVEGRKKSFTEEYAIGDRITFAFVFKISDVESFKDQKIDAQQLLDRGIITQNNVGRITVRLVSGQ